MSRLSGLAVVSAAVVALAAPLALAPASAAPAVPTTGQAVGPNVFVSRVIGHSVKGRPITAYRIGDPKAARTVVMLGAIHGDETGPSRILVNLRDGAPIRGANIWVIPYLNPDGIARHTRQNARGVDLNRNFPRGWVRQGGRYYSGRAPASEPETRALMVFLRNVQPRFVISLHQPLRGIDVSYGKARTLALRLAEGLELPKKVFNCNTGCHGTMTQWFNRVQPGAALTVEYGATMSRRQLLVTGPRGMLSAVLATRD